MGSRARPSSPARAPSPARVEEALDRTVAAELPRLLPRQRWFGSKGRAIAAVRAADWARLGERGWLGLVDVAFGAGADERYLVAFVLRPGAPPRGALSLPPDPADASVRAGAPGRRGDRVRPGRGPRGDPRHPPALRSEPRRRVGMGARAAPRSSGRRHHHPGAA